MFQYSGANDSVVGEENSVSSVVIDFGRNDGVYDAGLDLTGWNWAIDDDTTTFIYNSNKEER